MGFNLQPTMSTPKSLAFSYDDDSLDLEMDCTPIPPTPEAKKASFTIPKMSSFVAAYQSQRNDRQLQIHQDQAY